MGNSHPQQLSKISLPVPNEDTVSLDFQHIFFLLFCKNCEIKQA